MKSKSSPIKKLCKQISSQEAWLISDPHSLEYLSGCETLLPEEREAYLIVNPKQNFIIQSSFSPKNQHPEIKTLLGMSPTLVKKHLQQILEDLALKTLFIDKSSLYVDEYENLQSIKNLELKELNKQFIWDLRSVKTEREIKLIKKASQISSQTLKKVLKNLQVGISELELKREIIKNFYELGAEAQAFPSIVAFGSNSALPHHQPSDTKLKKDIPVLIDCGAMFEGYRADMTRTIWFGDKKSQKFLEIEKIIMAAYDAVETRLIASLPSITAANLDKAARSVISNAGYANNFIHTTGHGIGLEVHEPPSLNSRNNQKIIPGMVITIEPGIYLENQFGFRYENTVLVKENAVEELTK